MQQVDSPQLVLHQKIAKVTYYGHGVVTAALSRHLQHFLTRQAANGGGQMIHLSNLWMLRMPLSCAEDPGNMIYCLRLTLEFVSACRYQL